MIGNDIEVAVVDIRGDKVRLGITAPREISVHRKEVYDAIKKENGSKALVEGDMITVGNITFCGVSTAHATDNRITKKWQGAIRAVLSGVAFACTGGQCEAEGSVIVNVGADCFYCERVEVRP